jgi:hypothetical protein
MADSTSLPTRPGRPLGMPFAYRGTNAGYRLSSAGPDRSRTTRSGREAGTG